MLWMEKDWILIHLAATFDHWLLARRKEDIFSLKNKEFKQFAAQSKKVEIRRSAEKWHPWNKWFRSTYLTNCTYNWANKKLDIVYYFIAKRPQKNAVGVWKKFEYEWNFFLKKKSPIHWKLHQLWFFVTTTFDATFD